VIVGYSTLVHPGDTWEEMRHSIETYAPAVKALWSPDAPFAVSLRLSAASASTLSDDAGERARFRRWLDERDMFVYTVNAFPYGPFKGQPVLERVYEPDWSTEDRVRYTMQVADILAELAPPSVAPSIQTMPLAFGHTADVDVITSNVLRVVAHLVDLERRTGRWIKLALEPEPFCFLETTEETVRYFQEHVWPASPASLVRRHLGVVFDICHQSVQFEDIGASLRLLHDSGVPIFKLQAAAALRVPHVSEAAVEALTAFTGSIYLSQTTELRDGRLTRWLNLADAIAAWRADPTGDREWRTHFHVPIFLDDLGPFGTTRSSIEAALAVRPLCDHVEIETYTWDVLPAHLKAGDITASVVRELTWLRDALG
jgi:hypothetical protein